MVLPKEFSGLRLYSSGGSLKDHAALTLNDPFFRETQKSGTYATDSYMHEHYCLYGGHRDYLYSIHAGHSIGSFMRRRPAG